MVVGTLTRESCREAFKMGITAAQVNHSFCFVVVAFLTLNSLKIVSFLRSNAHPQIATRVTRQKTCYLLNKQYFRMDLTIFRSPFCPKLWPIKSISGTTRGTDWLWKKAFSMANSIRTTTTFCLKIIQKYIKLTTEVSFCFRINFISKDMDALIWWNDQKRLMIVKESSHDLIKKFYRQNKPK